MVSQGEGRRVERPRGRGTRWILLGTGSSQLLLMVSRREEGRPDGRSPPEVSQLLLLLLLVLLLLLLLVAGTSCGRARVDQRRAHQLGVRTDRYSRRSPQQHLGTGGPQGLLLEAEVAHCACLELLHLEGQSMRKPQRLLLRQHGFHRLPEREAAPLYITFPAAREFFGAIRRIALAPELVDFSFVFMHLLNVSFSSFPKKLFFSDRSDRDLKN